MSTTPSLQSTALMCGDRASVYVNALRSNIQGTIVETTLTHVTIQYVYLVGRRPHTLIVERIDPTLYLLKPAMGRKRTTYPRVESM